VIEKQIDADKREATEIKYLTRIKQCLKLEGIKRLLYTIVIKNINYWFII
jgi:hypothetical protein